MVSIAKRWLIVTFIGFAVILITVSLLIGLVGRKTKVEYVYETMQPVMTTTSAYVPDPNSWTNLSPIEQNQIDLTSNWTIYHATNPTDYTMRNVSLPTCVTSALFNAKLISDPLYGTNDVELRWIANSDWWFVNYFQIDSKTINESKVHLIIDNLDSIANIYVNDYFRTNVDNEFLKHEIEINSKLREGVNKISIRFRSPLKYASLLNETYPYAVPVVAIPDVQHGENGVNFIRKKASSFSWDWGPAFAPMGIYQNAYLSIIQNVSFDFSAAVYPHSLNSTLNEWIIDVDIDLVNNGNERLGDVRVTIDEISYVSYAPLDTTQKFHYQFNLSTKENPLKLWYPQGYGEQKMYKLNVTIKFGTGFVTKTKKIAFRSVELIQEPVLKNNENAGLSFYFKINQEKVFLKGSNWIPASNFQDQVDESLLSWLLYSTSQANMNVLRIWGGGQYEFERFYELADEYGILIWHDFMFACNFYPTNEEFLFNVKREVTYQVNRLRHHPSILIWAGNNENEAALVDDWYNIKADKVVYENDYRKLYIDTIRAEVQAIEPTQSRPFLSSSPTNGLQSERENWLAKNPYDWRYGDVHFYNYFMNGWDSSQYPVSRFLSEFGFQSFPSPATLRPVYNSSDMSYWSSLNNHRQHHGNGNNEILYEIGTHFNLPNMTNNPIDNFTYTIYLAQVHQAVSLKTATELCRRHRDVINSTGFGNCMGIMYWQLNDLWQAPTWSSIEYSGKWKLAHYYVKNAFAHLLISPTQSSTGQIDVHVISDYTNKTISDIIQIKVYNSEGGFEPKFSKNVSFEIQLFSSKIVTTLSTRDIDAFCSAKNCLVTFELANTSADSSESQNFWFYKDKFDQPIDNFNSGNAQIDKIIQLDANNFEVTLKVDFLSLFVWVDLDTIDVKGHFSTNGFHMTTQTKSIKYTIKQGALSQEDLQKNLRFYSIRM